MSYGLNVEMHKQVSYSISKDSNFMVGLLWVDRQLALGVC